MVKRAINLRSKTVSINLALMKHPYTLNSKQKPRWVNDARNWVTEPQEESWLDEVMMHALISKPYGDRLKKCNK